MKTISILNLHKPLVIISLLTAQASYGQTILENAFNIGVGSGGSFDAEYSISAGTKSGSIGPNWDVSTYLGLGLFTTVTHEMPANNTYSISSSGVLSVASTHTAVGTFASGDLTNAMQNNQDYRLSIGVSQSSLVGILSDATIRIGKTNGSTFTSFDEAGSGTGLLGLVDLLGLFGTSSTATLDFTGQALGAGESLAIEIETSALADVLSSGYSFNQLKIEQINTVPEPSSAVLLGLGSLALILRRRK